ncbi:YciI family protein [Rhodanobacter sp. BL-MT-08]
MFIVILTYVMSNDEVEKHLPDHRNFLKYFYSAGFGVVSGRQTAGGGGIIVASAASRAALDLELAKDPFHIHRVARYDILEFQPSMTHDGLKELI